MSFEDVAEPTKNLTKIKVGDSDEPTSQYRELTSYGDILSPSAIVSKGLEFAFDFNPVDEAKQAIAGNWEEYAECAKAWAGLNEFCTDLASNIRAGNKGLDSAWSGNTADSAYVYLESLAKDVEALGATFDELKDNYEVVTDGVWHAAEACGDLLNGILDTALLVGITAAAGASTSFTLVGPVIAGGAIAGEVAAMMTMYARITTVITEVQTMTSAAVAAVEQISRLGQSSFTKYPLPEKGYDNPAV
ncbi:hypothetical protein ABT127_16870 [Streptomyces sp. NPDC001904]|uniref:hypothetical protein n=1 Tax=Streptomyces sp. NPDC001904 TaxID=3154531 RepID=UPI00333202D5